MEIIINYLSNEAYDIFDQIVLKYYIYIHILELKKEKPLLKSFKHENIRT